MSLPIEADFAVVKMGNGATPEVFTLLCGLDQISINRTANTQDRFRRDCTTPGVPAYRRSRTTGKQMDITANGAINIPDIARYNTSLGVVQNYIIELGKYNTTSAGEIIHVVEGAFNLTQANSGVGDNSDASVTLASDGVWTEGEPD